VRRSAGGAGGARIRPRRARPCPVVRYGQRPQVFLGDPAIGGRYYYSDDLSGFNFTRAELPLAQAFAHMLRHADDPSAPTAYLGSLVAPAYLPGFAEANAVPIVPPQVEARLWIGNPSTAATHYDAYENLACVLAGARRFTLYPPDAIGDLYVGPIDHTMAGQPASLAAASADPVRYPGSRRRGTARSPWTSAGGDALFLPKLWWHQVEATAPVNVMLNYWWDATAIGPDAPLLAMLLSMIAIAERPEAERAAFRAFFDHYVFRPDGHPSRTCRKTGAACCATSRGLAMVRFARWCCAPCAAADFPTRLQNEARKACAFRAFRYCGGPGRGGIGAAARERLNQCPPQPSICSNSLPLVSGRKALTSQKLTAALSV
jgi:hypothetical protein